MSHDGQAMGAERPQTPKRFYSEVAVTSTEGGFGITLDGRALKTPKKAAFTLPVADLAEAAAAEWRGQGATIDLTSMPLNALANSAIDHVAQNAHAVRTEIRSFAAGDLVCYRATSPKGLVDRQATTWDPVLHWAEESLGARFILSDGIMPVEQPKTSLERVGQTLAGIPYLPLAAVSIVTTLTGSALLALCLVQEHLDGDAVWSAAHVDEDWQIEHWGDDDEAMARRRRRKLEFDTAALVLHHC